MRRLFVILLLVVLAAAGGGVAYYLYYGLGPTVKVTAASVGPVAEVVYGSGTVEPIEWAKVIPLDRRRLVSLCRCEGLQVTKDQVLGQQYDAEEHSRLDELQANHAQLLRDLDRAADDKKKGNITEAQYEQRQTAVQESESRLAAQKARLDSLVLRSPMNGMVLRRDGEVGEIVGPTDVLFWVGKPSPLQVVAEINEEEITKLAVGQTAYLASEAFADRSLRATVSQITPKGDPTKKTFRVYLQLPPDSPLRIGMTVEINIVFRERAQATLVPNEAVVNNAVEVVRDGRVHRVPVSLGVHGSRVVEVIGNVEPGALVVTPARLDLADGSRVQTDVPGHVAAEPKPAAARAEADTGSKPSSNPAYQSVDAAISAALSARIQSIVGDARKDAARSGP